jgi:hypothetical protein
VPYFEIGANAGTITDPYPRDGFDTHYRLDYGAGIGLLTRHQRFPDLLIGLSYDRRGARICHVEEAWQGDDRATETWTHDLSIRYLDLSLVMQQRVTGRGPGPFLGAGLEFSTPVYARSRDTVEGEGWMWRGEEDITSIVSAMDVGAVLQVGGAFRYGGLMLAPTLSYVMGLGDVHDGSFRVPENPYGLNYGASRVWRLRFVVRGGGAEPNSKGSPPPFDDRLPIR